MKILVIGKEGQLGSDFLQLAESQNVIAQGIDIPEIDISSKESIFECLSKYDFEILINTAAYHGYQAYEDKDPRKYYEVNVFGPYYLAEYSKEYKKTLVHYSTDYVFSGNILEKTKSFTEEILPHPANLYAASKLAGEQIIQTILDEYYIFRIASIYGIKGCKAKNQSNFVEIVINKLHLNKPFEVVNDIVMSPTSTISIVNKTFELLKVRKYGLYHLAGSGNCSWYDFAVKIAELMDLDKKLIIKSSFKKVHQEISRGSNTSLVNNKLISSGVSDLLPWELNLEEYLKNRTQIN